MKISGTFLPIYSKKTVSKSLLIVFTLLLGITIQAQDRVSIEIPGKHDLLYDGLSLQLFAPNLSVGKGAGSNISVAATRNTIFGEEAGFKLVAGDNNTYIGFQAGANNEGSGNVFLGYQAGIDESSTSNKLFIGNSTGDNPLIYGDFGAKTVTINDNLFVDQNLSVYSNILAGNNLNVVNDLSVDNDINVTSDVNIGNDLMVSNKVNLANYSSAQNEVLAVNSNGDLVNKVLKEEKYNKFSFIIDEDISSAYNIAQIGLNLNNGDTINGIKAYVLDNNSTGSTMGVDNSIFVTLMRLSIHDDTASEFELYRILGDLTPDDTYILHQELSTSTGCTSCKIVNNDKYIYFLKIFYCTDCDFRVVSILE